MKLARDMECYLACWPFLVFLSLLIDFVRWRRRGGSSTLYVVETDELVFFLRQVHEDGWRYQKKVYFIHPYILAPLPLLAEEML